MTATIEDVKRELVDHIWYTTRTFSRVNLNSGRATRVVCKCLREFDTADEHASHVTKIAFNRISAG